jgi:hypothetical protein
MHSVDARELPILITSAIAVSADQTQMMDIDLRIRSTIHAALKWRQLNPQARIVLCDGSGFDLKRHLSNEPTLASNLEFIGFLNDFELVKTFGKGRGEGEIINYALDHSDYLAEADVFCKCTGKLWVENHESFVRARRGPFAFDYHGRILPFRIDTRYYVASKREFSEILRNAFLAVDEPKGVDLESAYASALGNIALNRYVSPIVPLINGLSGSMGVTYSPARGRSLLKGLRNRLVRRIFGRALNQRPTSPGN